MNTKITKKDLQNNYCYIVRAGYCELSTMMRDANKIGYACGVYGWNWDAYEIQGTNGERVVICTGYRDMTGSDIEGKKKFEEKAKAIASNRIIDWKQQQKQAKKNLQKFADYCIEQIRASR